MQPCGSVTYKLNGFFYIFLLFYPEYLWGRKIQIKNGRIFSCFFFFIEVSNTSKFQRKIKVLNTYNENSPIKQVLVLHQRIQPTTLHSQFQYKSNFKPTDTISRYNWSTISTVYISKFISTVNWAITSCWRRDPPREALQ